MRKPDREMGPEVHKIGGFRPGGSPPGMPPIVHERFVEIVIVAKPKARPKPLHWYEKPTLQFATGLV